ASRRSTLPPRTQRSCTIHPGLPAIPKVLSTQLERCTPGACRQSIGSAFRAAIEFGARPIPVGARQGQAYSLARGAWVPALSCLTVRLSPPRDCDCWRSIESTSIVRLERSYSACSTPTRAHSTCEHFGELCLLGRLSIAS